MLPARHDDDDDDKFVIFFVYTLYQPRYYSDRLFNANFSV